ncbi:MAG: lasso peptide biosynthesis B2 protein [Rhodobacteraceae bacterium]|jgi:hypothetical protein|nr:lasso peptide biosynthesis B2 protein [Paracoccaceae bacterium]
MHAVRWGALHGLALVVVLVVRIGLWVTRYQRLRRLLVRPCPAHTGPEHVYTVSRVTTVVARVARLVPDGSCLTQTIACQAILSWKGVPSTIAIGVRKDTAQALQAHAWLVWNDRVVLQGTAESVQAFSKILDLPTPPLPFRGIPS